MTLSKASYSLALFAVLAAFGLSGCGDDKASENANFGMKGKVTNPSVRYMANGTQRVKTVTNVMAVNPESANPERYLADVASDGTFSIKVKGGRPYVLVFVDKSQIGSAMIVGLVKIGALDTLPAVKTEGETNLGDTAINGATETATPGASLADVLASLGISETEATAIGNIDNIAARYANPDVDGNGVIDMNENKKFGLDFHMRWNHKSGADVSLTIDDLVNAYAADDSKIAFGLGSAYAIWPKTFDNTTYTVGNALAGGVTLTFPVGAVDAAASHSALSFGDNTGFGGDWGNAVSMAGSGATPAHYVYGFNGKTLTFTNVATYSAAVLGNNVGRIMPFVKINADGALHITSVDYKWRILTVSGWRDATTADHVETIVNADGGYFSMFKGKQADGKGIGFKIPATSLSGTVTWNAASLMLSGATEADLSSMTKDDLCHFGLSYDDRLGMRIFDSFEDGNNNCAR